MSNNPIALVTGASQGIGKSISVKLIGMGYTVYGISRSKDKLENLAKQYDEFNYFAGDINDPDFIQNCIKSIKKNHNNLNYLVNNAAIEINDLIGMINIKNTEKIFSTNVYSVLNLIQLSSRIMRQGGSIVNISSNVAVKGNPGQISYGASKGAINSITKTAAKELAQKKIRVNSVLPGLTKTEMIDSTDVSFINKRKEQILLGRLVEPEDVANLVGFLCSPQSEMISGQIIAVDGLTIM